MDNSSTGYEKGEVRYTKHGVREALFILCTSVAQLFDVEKEKEKEVEVEEDNTSSSSSPSPSPAASASPPDSTGKSRLETVSDVFRTPAVASMKIAGSQLALAEHCANAVYDSITARCRAVLVAYLKLCCVAGVFFIALTTSLAGAGITGCAAALGVYTYIIPPSTVDTLPFALDYNNTQPEARIDLLGGEDCRAACLRSGGSDHEGCNITVELEIPETVHNLKIGVFTVRVSLVGEDGGEVAALKRSSVVVQERSELTKQAAELMLLPFTTAFGATATANKVVRLHMTPLLKRGVISKDLSHVVVQLTPSLHVSSSALRVATHTPGLLNRILVTFPLSVTTLTLLLASTAAFCLYSSLWVIGACVFYSMVLSGPEPKKIIFSDPTLQNGWESVSDGEVE